MKRLLTILLSVCMIITTMPASFVGFAYADDTEGQVVDQTEEQSSDDQTTKDQTSVDLTTGDDSGGETSGGGSGGENEVPETVGEVPEAAGSEDGGTGQEEPAPVDETAAFVAYIGETGYGTLTEALASAASGDTIKLAADIVSDAYIEITRTVTIDLAGHTISRNGNALLNPMGSGVTLTVKDSVGGGVVTSNIPIWVDPGANFVLESGTIRAADGNDNHGIYVDGGSATIAGGTVIGDKSAICIGDDASVIVESGDIITTGESAFTISLIGHGNSLTVNGGTITAQAADSVAISDNGNQGNSSDITINGGAITSAYDIAIYKPAAGTLTLKGGTINGGTGVFVKSGKLVVPEDSTVTVNANGEKKEYEHRGNGAISTGEAIVIESCNYPGGAPEAEIKGGTFSSENSTAVASVAFDDPASEAEEVPVTGFISGGTFTENDHKSDVSAYLAEGVTQNEDGTVAEETPAVIYTATLNNATYTVKGSGSASVKATITRSDGAVLTVEDKAGWGLAFDPDTLKVTNTSWSLKNGTVSFTVKRNDGASLRAYQATVSLMHGGEVAATATIDVQPLVALTTDKPNKLLTDGVEKITDLKINGVSVISNISEYTITSQDETIATVSVENGEVFITPIKAGKATFTIARADEPAVTAEASLTFVEPGAKIGDTYYKTLNAAFNAAAEGDTIILCSDVTETVNWDGASKTFALDLNGHTWTGKAGEKAALRFERGVLTIKDSVGGGRMEYGGDYAIIISHTASSDPSKVIIESGNFTGKTSVIQVGLPGGSGASYRYYGGDLVINGGTFTAVPDTGEEYDANGNFKYLLNMLDMVESAYVGGIYSPSTITVNGGIFNKFDPMNNSAEGTSTDFTGEGYVSYEISEGVYGVGQLAVSPTTRTGVAGNTGTALTVKIGGVKVTDEQKANLTWTSSDETVVTVAADGSMTYVAPGTATVTAKYYDSEATCKVTVKEPAFSITKNGETAYFDTLKNAIAAAADGDKIVMLADYSGTDFISYSKKAIELDLAGHSYTRTNKGTAVQVGANAGFTLIDSVGGGSLNSASNIGIETKAATAVVTVKSGTVTGGTWGISSDNGTVNVEGGTVQGTTVGVRVQSATVNISGGSVTGGEQGILDYNNDKPAAITITGGTITCTGTDATTSAICLEDATVLSISEADPEVPVTISGGHAGIAVFDAAKVTVSGGTISGSVFGITGNGTDGYGGYEIKVSGGAISANEVGIYHPNNGTLEISGGSVTGATAIYQKSGTLNITGGTLKATGDAAEFVHNDNGVNVTGDTIVVENCSYPGGAPAASITGGKFESVNAETVASYAWTEEGAAEENKPIENFVTGGAFVGEVIDKATLPEGKTLKLNEEDGLYYIADSVITVSPTTRKVVEGNTGTTLTVKIDGVKATDEQKANVTWTSSDETVVTVAADGSMTYVASGTATITAKYYGSEATCEVTVQEAAVEFTSTTGKVSYLANVDYSNVSSSGTYKLLKDITAKSRIAPAVLASNVVLDLNGHTLTSMATDQVILLNRGGTASAHKTFAIVDSSEDKGGKIVVAGDIPADHSAISVGGKYNDLTIGEGVTIEGGGVALTSENQTLTVKGTINAGNDFAIATNGSTTKNATITIEDPAVITSDDVAIYLPGTGTATISGGSVTGATAIYQKSGTLNITGGTFKATGAASEFVHNGNGANATGDAIVVENCSYPGGAPVASITGGKFESVNGETVASYAWTEEGAAEENQPIENFVTGGAFVGNEIDKATLPEGKTLKLNEEDGLYYIVDEFTVTFNAGGGQGTMDEVKVASGDAYTLPACGFTVAEDCLVFDGWRVGEEIKAPGSEIVVTGDITIVATWKYAHTLKHHDAISETCTTDGQLEHWECTVCGKLFSDEAAETELATAVIPMTGHDWNDWVVIKEATCEEDGTRYRTCKNNPIHVELETIAKTGHTLTHVEAKDSTYDETGNIEYWHCENCGKYFSDEAGTLEITEEETVVAKKTLGMGAAEGITQTWTVTGNESETVTIKITDMELKYSEIDTSIGRNIEAAWAGYKLIAPEGIDAAYLSGHQVTYKVNDGAAKSFNTNNDGKVGSGTYADRLYLQAWAPIEEGLIPAAQDGIRAFQYTYAFDWNADGEYEQTYKVIFDINDLVVTDLEGKPVITLKEGVLTYPHRLTKTDAVEATCEEAGNIEYWVCEDCGKIFSDAEGTTEITAADAVVAPTGHIHLTATEAKAATCSAEGNIAYWTCDDCGKYFSDAEAATEITKADTVIAVDASAHDWNEWVVIKAATCTEDGTKYRTCKNDPIHVEIETIAKTGHSLTHVEAKDPTYTAEGNTEYWYCESCGEYFSDAEGTAEITQADTVIPKLAVGLGTVDTPYSMTGTVTGSGTAEETVEFSDLTLTYSPAKPEIGRTIDAAWAGFRIIAPEGVTEAYLAEKDGNEFKYPVKYSNDGSDELVKYFNTNKDGTVDGKAYMQAWVPVTDDMVRSHIEAGQNTISWTYKFDWNSDGAADQTLTVKVNVSDITINDLQGELLIKTEDDVIVYPHTLSKTDAVAATCTEAGNIDYWVCEDCGKIFSDAEGKTEVTAEAVVIAPTGHVHLTATEAKAATCSAEGNIAYWTCDDCGKYFSDAEGKNEITKADTVIAVDANAHDWNEWVVIKEATCTEAGTKYRTCKHNSIHIEMASIEATGHDIKHFDAVEATCKDAGNIEYWYCENCGKYFSDAEGTTEITQADTLIPVDKTKHVWDDGTVTTPASFAGDGVMTYTCTVCGETRTEPITKYGFTVKVDGKEITDIKIVEDGYDASYENYYQDADGNWVSGGKVESIIPLAIVKVPYGTTAATVTLNDHAEAYHTYYYTREPDAGGYTQYIDYGIGDMEDIGGYQYPVAHAGTAYEAEVAEDQVIRVQTKYDPTTWTSDNLYAIAFDYEDAPVTENEIIRIAGPNRYDTAIAAADHLKKKLGVSSFANIIIVSGEDFPDALSATYLATVKDAPILLVGKTSAHVAKIADYVNANLTPGGTVYIVGGTGAVPASMDSAVTAGSVKRLAGSNRYATNVEVLKEAGIAGKDLLVASGNEYADALSASAAGRPILLVGTALTADQTAYLGANGAGVEKVYIVGGVGAVNDNVKAQVEGYAGAGTRIAGSNRYDTSKRVAETFFPGDVDTLVIASGNGFPDGLSGGPVTIAYEAPLVLVADGSADHAVEFFKTKNAHTLVVMGGIGAVSKAVAEKIADPAKEAE